MGHEWKVHNPDGTRRVVVTKELPGTRWLDILIVSGAVKVLSPPMLVMAPTPPWPSPAIVTAEATVPTSSTSSVAPLETLIAAALLILAFDL